MRLLDEAKQFFWLRRIALALEKQNEISEKYYNLQEQEWAEKHVKPLRNKMELGVMDPEEVGKRYLQQLEAEREGIEPED